MLCCYMVICIAPLIGGYSWRSQRDRQMKRRVFKQRRGASDIPCGITLRSAGGVSFQSIHVGPIVAKARFWDREIRDQSTRGSQRSAGRGGRQERADL